MIKKNIMKIVFESGIGMLYREKCDLEIENRSDYEVDIKEQKRELSEGFSRWLSIKIANGCKSGDIKTENEIVVGTNVVGEKIIKEIYEAKDELEENLKNVESVVSIEPDFECDYCIDREENFGAITEALIEYSDETEESLDKKFMDEIEKEIKSLSSEEKEAIRTNAKVFVDAVIYKKDINIYKQYIAS